MGRKYMTSRTQKHGWGLNLCEEKLLIGVYLDLRPRLAPTLAWPVTFEQDFFINGIGVLFETVKFINIQLTRLGRPELEFAETAADEYARSADRGLKAERRRMMREGYEGLDTAGKVRWVNEAAMEVAALAPPTMTLEDYKAHMARREEAALPDSRQTVLRRIAEHAFQTPPAAPQTPVPAEAPEPAPQTTTPLNGHHGPAIALAIKRLRLATKPETIAAIIAKIEPDDALTVAECAELAALGKPELVDELVMRSLE